MNEMQYCMNFAYIFQYPKNTDTNVIDFSSMQHNFNWSIVNLEA
jgi:hypothetical protein